MIDLRYLHTSSGTVLEIGNVAQNISYNYPPFATNSITIPPAREVCSFARDPRIPPYNPINNNPPQPSGKCLFDHSLMTDDAWKVLSMIEQANEACSRKYSGYDFGSTAEPRRDYFDSVMKPSVNPGAPPPPDPAPAAAKPKIWSVEDIIGDSSSDGQSSGSGLDNEAPKVTAGCSSSSDDVINVYGRGKQSADGSGGVVFSDYGYLDGNQFSGTDMPQLDAQFMAPSGSYHEPAKKSLDQIQQEIVDGYCCKYVTQIYYQKVYYKCIYCHRCFSTARQLCQHQIVEHRLIIS